MPGLSIIIPVYRTEAYIAQCARSLFEQTLEDVEFIFVDDKSDDGAVDVLEQVVAEYPERSRQVRIARLPANIGIAAVRRRGLELANGDWIAYCDSDDWVEADMYASLLEVAEARDADMVSCDILSEDGSPEPEIIVGATSQPPDLVMDAFRDRVPILLSNRIFRRSLIIADEISWPVANQGEDMALTLQMSLLSRRNVHVSRSLYHYRRHAESLTGRRGPQAAIAAFEANSANVDLVAGVLRERGLEGRYAEALERMKYGTRNLLLPAVGNGVTRARWLASYPEINSKVLGCRVFTLKDKAIFLAVWMGVYPWVRRMMKR